VENAKIANENHPEVILICDLILLLVEPTRKLVQQNPISVGLGGG
jgi:hypothetical protein